MTINCRRTGESKRRLARRLPYGALCCRGYRCLPCSAHPTIMHEPYFIEFHSWLSHNSALPLRNDLIVCCMLSAGCSQAKAKETEANGAVHIIVFVLRNESFGIHGSVAQRSYNGRALARDCRRAWDLQWWWSGQFGKYQLVWKVPSDCCSETT